MIPPTVEDDNVSSSKSDHGDLDDDLGDDISKGEESVTFSPEHLSKLYVFALIWSMGAFLDTDDRNKYDIFLKDKLNHLDLPVNNSRNKTASIK